MSTAATVMNVMIFFIVLQIQVYTFQEKKSFNPLYYFELMHF